MSLLSMNSYDACNNNVCELDFLTEMSINMDKNTQWPKQKHFVVYSGIIRASLGLQLFAKKKILDSP